MDSFYSAVDFAEREPTVASKEKAVSGLTQRLPTFDYDSLSFGMRVSPLGAKEMPGKAIPLSLLAGKEIRIVSSSGAGSGCSAAQTAQKREKTSPCPERPGYLTRFHAYAQQKDFSVVRTTLEAAVHSMDSEHLDGEFDESQCMWRMKYFHGADVRELHLCVYWDSRREDHCIELLRVSDTGREHSQSFSTYDFFAHFRSALSPSAHSPLVAHKKRIRSLPPPPLVLVSSKENVNDNAALPPPPARLSRSSSGEKVSLSALPLPSASVSVSAPLSLVPPPPAALSPPSSSSAVCGSPAMPAWALPITKEEYVSGVRQLTALLADTHYETRCECARAVCALAQKLAHSHAQSDCCVEKQLLVEPECVEEIVHALSELLCDEWEEVVELAVMAVSLFSDFEQYTAALGSQPKVIEKLLSLTLELADTSALSYKTLMSRRRAALSLSLLVQHQKARLCVLDALRERGLDSMEAWNDECVERIADSRAQNFAKQLLLCL